MPRHYTTFCLLSVNVICVGFSFFHLYDVMYSSQYVTCGCVKARHILMLHSCVRVFCCWNYFADFMFVQTVCLLFVEITACLMMARDMFITDARIFVLLPFLNFVHEYTIYSVYIFPTNKGFGKTSTAEEMTAINKWRCSDGA